MEGRSSMVVLLVVAVVAGVGGSVGENPLDGGKRVGLVAPVLAPPRGSLTHVLLSRPDLQAQHHAEPEIRSLMSPQPIYVEKLEDQDRPQHNMQKRHLKKKGHQQQYQPQQIYYQQPVYRPQPVYYQQQVHRPQPVYHQPSGCGGGCGGGQRGGSTATATAFAQSSSSNYKK